MLDFYSPKLWNRNTSVALELEQVHRSQRVLDPYNRTGHRRRLQRELSRLDYGVAESTSFEILSCKRQRDGCFINGVIQFDVHSKVIAKTMINFKKSGKAVLQAVDSAFGYSPGYTQYFDFQVLISGDLDLEEAALKAKFAAFKVEEQMKAIAWLEQTFGARFESDHLKESDVKSGVVSLTKRKSVKDIELEILDECVDEMVRGPSIHRMHSLSTHL